MRTALEAVLQAMVSEGWANASGGSVDSPQGHYARITIESAELGEVQGAFNDEMRMHGLNEDDAHMFIGYWLVVEDAQGNVSVTAFANEPLLTRAFLELDDANAQWAEANA
jgi:hypothetical protein